MQMPIQKTFWAVRFGTLVDQFDMLWMINCEQARGPQRMDRLLSEALHRGGFVVVDIENRHQLRYLQHFLEFRPQIAKL